MFVIELQQDTFKNVKRLAVQILLNPCVLLCPWQDA